MSEQRRAPRGRTYDPCPGCKKPPEKGLTHPKDEVCGTCTIALAAGREAMAKQAAETEREAYLLPWFFPGYHDAKCEPWRRAPDGYEEFLGGRAGGVRDSADWLRELLPALALEVGEVVLGSNERYHSKAVRKPVGNVFHIRRSQREGSNGSRELILLPPRVRGLLRDVDRAVRMMIAETRANSLEEGTNLIGQLATGGITGDTLTETVARDVKHRRAVIMDIERDNRDAGWND